MPRIALELAKTSQFILQNNWKFEEVGSNIKRSKIEKLKISKDQNNAKFRWNHKLVFSTNNKTITAKKGSVISKDNIKNKFKDKQGFNLFIWKKRKEKSFLQKGKKVEKKGKKEKKKKKNQKEKEKKGYFLEKRKIFSFSLKDDPGAVPWDQAWLPPIFNSNLKNIKLPRRKAIRGFRTRTFGWMGSR